MFEPRSSVGWSMTQSGYQLFRNIICPHAYCDLLCISLFIRSANRQFVIIIVLISQLLSMLLYDDIITLNAIIIIITLITIIIITILFQAQCKSMIITVGNFDYYQSRYFLNNILNSHYFFFIFRSSTATWSLQSDAPERMPIM